MPAALKTLQALPPPLAAPAAEGPLLIARQGSFAIGGTVLERADPGGGPALTFHGDHAAVSYQVPVGARRLPIVMWHGMGQFSKTWSTTPDGREGFDTVFVRRGFPVYLIEQPRRGSAGRGTVAAEIAPAFADHALFNSFRIGAWPNYHRGVQFSRDPAALAQFHRQQTPSVGPIDIDLNTDVVAALFGKIGPGILLTHSHSGGMGWLTAIKAPNIRGIVAYEPAMNFVFPPGEVPDPITNYSMTLTAREVPLAEFLKLTRIPILICYGDNIPDAPSETWADTWRIARQMAGHWRDAINAHGGDVRLVSLPDIGIRGNTHFPFSDVNSIQIADHLSAFLEEKGLDLRSDGDLNDPKR